MNVEDSKIKAHSIKEEIANSITHGMGVVFSIVALTILLVYSIWNRNTAAIVGFSIYGFCSIVLYVASTLYHSFQKEKVKKILRVFDHASIYLFIAGTYTPIALLAMKGYWRIGILSTVWTIALLGIVFKIVTFNKFEKYKALSLGIYIAMGWIIVIAIKPMLEMIPLGFFVWLLAGGMAYTVGTIFYAIKKIPYNHAIWHLFVLAGGVLHFLGIFRYLV
ncbi:channel protein, hemolysin III family [Alkaliphilus metalliredigens QYMF]|uniref:Channel protein, hemolysin III family n=1 Tax=Alkaliphilus metalliredigens (strain QYMF) TaxID=293826 RepID=A6TVX0_ALKMQ|nr:hemolysin III family protein [Alkaliphilus metalliredigens]ABR50338.1 channel protein, hemolysin III family [Alkaliphilus metalliredigens QYMF]